jgi:hypothetical protein
MPIDPEALYIQLGRLAQNIPALGEYPIPTETQQWLGKLDALLSATGDLASVSELRTQLPYLRTAPGYRAAAAQAITIILHRALAAAELNAPVASAGSFIPAGNVFDAMTAIGKVLGAVTQNALIVDPYMDEKVLTDFAALAPVGATIRLLADQHYYKSTLQPAQQRWLTQYGASRPLEVRLTAPRTLHDRLIIIDDAQTWVLTQSLNAFATRSPASLVRVDDGTAVLKISAYAAIWQAATPL